VAAQFGMPEITVVGDYSITPELATKCFNTRRDSLLRPVDLETYKNKFWAIPDFCWVFLHKETDQVIGYFIILPFTDDAIKRYMNGKLTFDAIKPSDLQKLSDDSLYNLFWDTKAICKQYRTKNMIQLIVSLVANAMIERARRFSFCNYILMDVHRDFSKTLAEVMATKLLTKVKYTNGLECSLYGRIFDYRDFSGLPNYGILEFAYNNKHAAEILKGAKDLWRERNG
jgi:hypothetical protein